MTTWQHDNMTTWQHNWKINVAVNIYVSKKVDKFLGAIIFVFLICRDHRNIFWGTQKRYSLFSSFFSSYKTLEIERLPLPLLFGKYSNFLINMPSESWAYCDWFFTIFTAIWLFPCVSPFMLLKNKLWCKYLSTLFTAEYFFPSCENSFDCQVSLWSFHT